MRKNIVGKAVTANGTDKYIDVDIPTSYFDIVQRSLNKGRYKKDTNAVIVDAIKNFLNTHK